MSNCIKFFFTGNNVTFADLLCRTNVPAYSVEGGVLLDLDALDAIPRAELPAWVHRNVADMHSPFKTRPCYSHEWPGDRWSHCAGNDGNYVIVVYMSCGFAHGTMEETAMCSPYTFYHAKKEAERWAKEFPGGKETTAVCVQDRKTGEILYTVQMEQ